MQEYLNGMVFCIFVYTIRNGLLNFARIDCIYSLSINLAPNEIPLGAKSIGKV